MWFYETLKKYAEEKKIHWNTAKQRYDSWKLIKIYVWKKKIIIDIKEAIKYLITKL